MKGKRIFLIFAALLVLGFFSANAQEFSSANFKVLGPVVQPSGGFASSPNFRLWSSVGETGIGLSNASSFGVKSGSLYFLGPPAAPSGIAAAVVSASQINVTWTDNANNETGFQIERKTGAGGIYGQVATTTADATSFPDSGLSAATNYFYRVRAYNQAGSSDYGTEAGATTQSASAPPGGGGGGPSIVSPVVSQSSVTISGRAYPKSLVTIIVDGAVKQSIAADSAAVFSTRFDSPSGFHSFSIYSSDSKGRRSITYTFSFTLTAGVASDISGIFLSPTIDIDKSEVKKGDKLNVFGQTIPSSTVSIMVNSTEEIVESRPVGNDGVYLFTFDTNRLGYGDHSVKSQAALSDIVSALSRSLSFKVGTKSTLKNLPGDLNLDGRVNATDFSILLYWWGNASARAMQIADINKDIRIDIRDLSIMMFYWSG
jgi:hypothetical protein